MNYKFVLYFLKFQHQPSTLPHNLPQSSDIEFQCVQCSRPLSSDLSLLSNAAKNSKMKRSFMLQHLSSTLHRNKSTVIMCLNCNLHMTCYSQDELINHSCSLSSLLQKSITPSNSSRGRTKNSTTTIQTNYPDCNDVEECEFIDDTIHPNVHEIDSD